MQLQNIHCLRKPTLSLSLSAVVLLFLIQYGCSRSDPPPHFNAGIVDVYGNEFQVNKFVLLYWWEERGDTPFLYPYTHIAKQFIFEVMTPLQDNPRRVTVSTERIPFEEIDSATISLGTTCKNINIKTVNGRVVTAPVKFPKVLKKGEKTGLADSKIYVKGETADNKEFKLELDLVKSIKFIPVSAQ